MAALFAFLFNLLIWWGGRMVEHLKVLFNLLILWGGLMVEHLKVLISRAP